MSQYACEWRNVTVRFGKRTVLHTVTLGVRCGELVGLFGHNGAGKSTLLRTLLGLIPVQNGQVLVEGTPVGARQMSQIRRRIGYVPQVLNTDPRVPLTALDVVMTGLYAGIGIGRFPSRQNRESAQDALRKMQVLHLARQPFGVLSGGEQQRVLLARAIASAPRLLLMDEPTSSVDWQFVHELIWLIRQVHESGSLSTIVVSHDAPFLARLCDRVVLMESGRVLGEVSAEGLLDYLGRGWV